MAVALQRVLHMIACGVHSWERGQKEGESERRRCDEAPARPEE